MSDIPVTDWDLIWQWEWFRRAEWRPGFRSVKLGEGGGSSKAFVDLCQLIGAQVALDSSCGLGQKTLCMSEMGLNVVGSDGSETAVRYARELAKLETAATTFFSSRWRDLPRNAPHHFDAVFNDALGWVPTWDALGAALVGIFHALKPGGFLMFMGAGQEDDPAATRIEQLHEWENSPHEYVDWTYRDGALSCSKIVQKTKADDYIDDRLLYVSTKAGEHRLESTTLRRPAYWNWQHWRELTQTAGFTHLETRTYERYGHDGGPICVNVAWKLRGSAPAIDQEGRNAPYVD